ncbi:MAG: hypothetical protein RI894_362, partial [Bacteroidota bacterium]
MQKIYTATFVALFANAMAFAQTATMTYPDSKPDKSVQEDFFGTKVADPYRALEDPNTAQTKEWVEAQNKTTFGYLSKISFRGDVEKRLTTLWNFERYGVPMLEGGKYYFYKNDGLQNQSILYMTDDPFGESGKPVLDPNKL